MKLKRVRNLAFGLMVVASTVTQSRADLAPGYTMQTFAVPAEGQFTAYDGNIHYWTGANGYQIYNVAGGTTTTIGMPPGGVINNGFGDAFGVLDRANGWFYAGTYDNSAS